EALKAKLAEAEAEKKAEEKKHRAALARVRKYAGESHARTMLELYELLGVDPEHSTTRMSRGTEVRVNVDRDETVRSRRLLTIIEGLVDAVDDDVLAELQRADREDRDSRKPKPKTRRAEPVAEYQHEEAEDVSSAHLPA